MLKVFTLILGGKGWSSKSRPKVFLTLKTHIMMVLKIIIKNK